MGREIDVEDIVEEHWPYDGPHTDDKVVDALSAAVQLIRYANNATQRRMQYAASVYSATSMVHSLVASLEQLLDQLAEMTERMADDPDLYDDRYSDAYPPRDVALAAAALLVNTGRPREDLQDALGRATTVLVHLGHR